MTVQKNIQFTNLIKAGGRLREFNFRRSQGSIGPMFTVDVADEKGERRYLVFRQEDKRWKLEGNKPEAWIEEVIPQILKAMVEW